MDQGGPWSKAEQYLLFPNPDSNHMIYSSEKGILPISFSFQGGKLDDNCVNLINIPIFLYYHYYSHGCGHSVINRNWALFDQSLF